MNIDFYWVLYFLALVAFAAIGLGLSGLVSDRSSTDRKRVDQ